MQYVENAYQIIFLILSGLVLFIGIIGIFKGWFKIFKKFGSLATKTNLFIDKMLPDLLNHLCKTGRAPKDALTKWATFISEGNVGTSSPIQIMRKGREVIKEAGIDQMFENNKEKWAQKIKEKNRDKATKYDIESTCVNLIASLFNNDDEAFDLVKNYMYENPKKIGSADIYTLAGILLRDYIFENHPDWIK